MTIKEYLERCEQLAGDNWDYYNEQYSFATARKEGMTPEHAIDDCKEWLD